MIIENFGKFERRKKISVAASSERKKSLLSLNDRLKRNGAARKATKICKNQYLVEQGNCLRPVLLQLSSRTIILEEIFFPGIV